MDSALCSFSCFAPELFLGLGIDLWNGVNVARGTSHTLASDGFRLRQGNGRPAEETIDVARGVGCDRSDLVQVFGDDRLRGLLFFEQWAKHALFYSERVLDPSEVFDRCCLAKLTLMPTDGQVLECFKASSCLRALLRQKLRYGLMRARIYRQTARVKNLTTC